jgi:hypothetical protein
MVGRFSRALLVLCLCSACAVTGGTAPIPQGPDWYFVSGGYKKKTVVSSSGAYTTTQRSGNVETRTTHYWHYQSANQDFSGISAPIRPRVKLEAPRQRQTRFEPLPFRPMELQP